MPELDVKKEFPPESTMVPAAKRLLFANLGESWVRDHPFGVGERITLDEAKDLLPWLKEIQEEECRSTSL